MIVGIRSMAWANWGRTVPGSRDAPGPVHDQRRAGPAQPGVALPELVRRVAGPGPGPRVVVVGAEPAPVVVVGEVVGHRLPDVRGEAVLVDAAGHAPLGAGAVVGEDHDERVVQRAEALERGEHPADLRVGVGQEAGEDLLLAGEHAPLLGREVGPGLDPLGPVGEHGALGHHARGDLAGEHLRPPGVPPLVEHAPVGVDPLGRHVVRGVHGAEREVQEEGLARRPLLLVLHHADGLVGQVLAQVVALLGPARRLDVVVVADQVRGPVVGVALEEPVVALEAEAERPGVERPGGRALPARREVPFADGHGRVAGVAQEAGERGGRLGQAGVVAGEGQRDVGQEAHPDRVVVAPGEERGPGRASTGR